MEKAQNHATKLLKANPKFSIKRLRLFMNRFLKHQGWVDNIADILRVVGYNNTISGIYSTATGGYYGTASGGYSSVSGGNYNTASNWYSSISGGSSNTASGDSSSISGGQSNTASGPNSSVSGGYDNEANAFSSKVSGGQGNLASGLYSSINGGQNNTASGESSSISGGYINMASGQYSHIGGGAQLSAPSLHSTISGARPDYDSGWIELNPGEYRYLEHNLYGTPDKYVVDMQAMDGLRASHQFYGGDFSSTTTHGLFGDYLGSTNIRISRRSGDSTTDKVRVRIWKY